MASQYGAKKQRACCCCGMRYEEMYHQITKSGCVSLLVWAELSVSAVRTSLLSPSSPATSLDNLSLACTQPTAKEDTRPRPWRAAWTLHLSLLERKDRLSKQANGPGQGIQTMLCSSPDETKTHDLKQNILSKS